MFTSIFPKTNITISGTYTYVCTSQKLRLGARILETQQESSANKHKHKPSILTPKSHIRSDKGMFSPPNRDVKIGDNRKTGIEAKQIGEREMRDRQTERLTKTDEIKPIVRQEACLKAPT